MGVLGRNSWVQGLFKVVLSKECLGSLQGLGFLGFMFCNFELADRVQV